MSSALDLDDVLTELFGINERQRRRAEIVRALDDARGDYVRYRDGAASKIKRRELANLIKLIDAALDVGAAHTRALLDRVGDGLAIDALMDWAMGYGDEAEPNHWAGRNLAGAVGTANIWRAIIDLRTNAELVHRASRPEFRNRRTLRFIQVVHLAAWYARTTGKIPKAYVDEKGRARGAFGDLVEAINASIGIDRRHTSLGEIVLEALAVCAVPIENAADLGVPLPAFGSPGFILVERERSPPPD